MAAILDGFAAAVVAGDHAALDALLDADYQFVSAQARVVGRERRLATLVSGARVLARLEFAEPDLRELGETALVRAAFTASFRPDGDFVRVDRGVSTFVFVRRDPGRWRLVHQHNSHVDGA